MIIVDVVKKDDDLLQLVAEINAASWDDANEISDCDAESLSMYLDRQDTIFLVCHEVKGEDQTLLGMASSRLEIKPYASERWLYVGEVDVCGDQWRRGAGTAMSTPRG